MKMICRKVLVRPDTVAIQTPGGLYLPEITLAKMRSQWGTVVSVAEGVTECKTGDRVLFGKYVGREYELDGVLHYSIREPDILAVEG